jgi:hypothetical protein
MSVCLHRIFISIRSRQQQQAYSAQQDSKVLLTVSEVVRRLCVETITVERWIVTGILDVVILLHRGQCFHSRIKQRRPDELLLPSVKTDSEYFEICCYQEVQGLSESGSDSAAH